jgi:hypothetical protein
MQADRSGSIPVHKPAITNDVSVSSKLTARILAPGILSASLRTYSNGTEWKGNEDVFKAVLADELTPLERGL